MNPRVAVLSARLELAMGNHTKADTILTKLAEELPNELPGPGAAGGIKRMEAAEAEAERLRVDLMALRDSINDILDGEEKIGPYLILEEKDA